MPACCTLRLNCFSATSNELPGLTIIWLIEITSAIYRYFRNGYYFRVAGSNPDNRRGDPLWVEREQWLRSRSLRRWRCTWGVLRVRGTLLHAADRLIFPDIRLPVFGRRDIRGNGWVNWSVRGLHKILAHL
jgi:hypothetical protein